MTSWFRDYKCEGRREDKSKCDDDSGNKIPTSRRPRHRFDFEVGYLIKSPCRSCINRCDFPGCDETCETLDKIHTVLRESVSCTKHG